MATDNHAHNPLREQLAAAALPYQPSSPDKKNELDKRRRLTSYGDAHDDQRPSIEDVIKLDVLADATKFIMDREDFWAKQLDEAVQTERQCLQDEHERALDSARQEWNKDHQKELESAQEIIARLAKQHEATLDAIEEDVQQLEDAKEKLLEANAVIADYEKVALIQATQYDETRRVLQSSDVVTTETILELSRILTQQEELLRAQQGNMLELRGRKDE